jgi:Tfp pilus assembly protein PilN
MSQVHIDFVPDEYIQRKESRRANYFYFAILALIVFAIGGSYSLIKIRQHAIAREAKAVDAKMITVQLAVKQLEQIQSRKQEMMKTALLTAELIEPVPRSLIVAQLTNALPDNVSLIKVEIEKKTATSGQSSNKYDAVKAAQKNTGQNLVTELVISGLAENDIGVADFIAGLSMSEMLENVCLVQSKNKEKSAVSHKEFKLTAQVRRDFTGNLDNVETIRNYQAKTQF